VPSGVGCSRVQAPASASRRDFRVQLVEIASGEPILEVVFASPIPARETVCQEATDLDAENQALAKQSPLAQRLTSVPGVGPIVALSFIATIDDATGLRRAAEIGADAVIRAEAALCEADTPTSAVVRAKPGKVLANHF